MHPLLAKWSNTDKLGLKILIIWFGKWLGIIKNEGLGVNLDETEYKCIGNKQQDLEIEKVIQIR